MDPPDSWAGRFPPEMARELTGSMQPKVLLKPRELGRPEDCPWCGLGEGNVRDCHCGMQVCAVCAGALEGDAYDCTCGWALGAGV